MTRLVAASIALALSGCVCETEHGKCIGLADEKDPALLYSVSAWNVAMGAIFVHMIVPPIVVATSATFCPYARRAPEALKPGEKP